MHTTSVETTDLKDVLRQSNNSQHAFHAQFF